MKRIAVLTSGGDAPGMNAAISAVVMRGLFHGLEVFGFYKGYVGLMNNDIIPLDYQNVQGIIPLGGTILKSARSQKFMTEEGRRQALTVLKENEIDGLVVIGGNGTIKGAHELAKYGYPVVGIPATIDNDLAGTEYTIGFDTAVNTVVDAIDNITTTAYSFERIIVVEVMGRHAGNIALWAGMSSGADAIVIPEANFAIEDIVNQLKKNEERGKKEHIIVVAEGVCSGEEFKKLLQKYIDIEVRVLVPGYLQRGGPPNVLDRMLASKMGGRAVDLLVNNQNAFMVGWKNGDILDVPFESIHTDTDSNLDINDYYLAKSLLG